MNIEQIRDFLCVAETLNLTLAADRRNTTQSNLSKRLCALEAFLDRRLVDRRTRPLCLTKAGEDFVPKARQILLELDDFRGQSAPWCPSEGGVSIVMPHSASVAVFPRLKERLAHKMPGVQFAPRLANHDTAARLLARSEVDLALVTRHPAVAIDDNFSVFRHADIGVDCLVVVELPDTPVDEALPLHVSHPLTYIGKIWQTCRCALPVSQELHHGMAADIRMQCLSGHGRGVLPETLVEADIAAGRLIVRRVEAKLSYAVSLFCAPRAPRRARQVWASVDRSDSPYLERANESV